MHHNFYIEIDFQYDIEKVIILENIYFCVNNKNYNFPFTPYNIQQGAING